MISNVVMIVLTIIAIRGFIMSYYESSLRREVYEKIRELDEYMNDPTNKFEIEALQVMQMRTLLSRFDLLVQIYLESSTTHLKNSLSIHKWKKKTIYATFIKETNYVITTISQMVGMSND